MCCDGASRAHLRGVVLRGSERHPDSILRDVLGAAPHAHLRHGAVPADDAQHGALREVIAPEDGAVRIILADRGAARVVRAAGAIDLANDAAANPGRVGVAALDNADKLMSERVGVSGHIAFQDLQVLRQERAACI